MSQMNCPRCGLNVAFKRGEQTGDHECCPRCLARSCGTVSVLLLPGSAPKPVRREDRVRALLRKLGPHRTAAV
jgi:hypothetical protein